MLTTYLLIKLQLEMVWCKKGKDHLTQPGPFNLYLPLTRDKATGLSRKRATQVRGLTRILQWTSMVGPRKIVGGQKGAVGLNNLDAESRLEDYYACISISAPTGVDLRQLWVSFT